MQPSRSGEYPQWRRVKWVSPQAGAEPVALTVETRDERLYALAITDG